MHVNNGTHYRSKCWTATQTSLYVQLWENVKSSGSTEFFCSNVASLIFLRCRLQLPALLKTLEVDFMLTVAPKPVSTCRWRSLKPSLRLARQNNSRAFLWIWLTPGFLWWQCTRGGCSQRWVDQMHRWSFKESLQRKLSPKTCQIFQKKPVNSFRLLPRPAAPPWFRPWKD